MRLSADRAIYNTFGEGSIPSAKSAFVSAAFSHAEKSKTVSSKSSKIVSIIVSPLTLYKKLIPKNIDYKKIKNIANEAKQKLEQIRPTSLGQALRISGVNPSDISVLMIYLKKEYNNGD